MYCTYILIANQILNYGLYENTVETQYCILFLEKPFEITLFVVVANNEYLFSHMLIM